MSPEYKLPPKNVIIATIDVLQYDDLQVPKIYLKSIVFKLKFCSVIGVSDYNPSFNKGLYVGWPICAFL